jgi:hypothetical protein
VQAEGGDAPGQALGTVATPEQFANLVAGEQQAGEAQTEHEAAKAHPAYEPVRQHGADRLEPINAIYLSDGYARGTTNRVNPVEVEAVAAQVEKCIADPAYDGQTFGVISLLGTAQAKRIESQLLERVSPEEWEAASCVAVTRRRSRAPSGT